MTNILTLMSSSKKKIARVFFQQEQNGSLLKCTSVQKTWQTCWNFSLIEFVFCIKKNLDRIISNGTPPLDGDKSILFHSNKSLTFPKSQYLQMFSELSQNSSIYQIEIFGVDLYLFKIQVSF